MRIGIGLGLVVMLAGCGQVPFLQQKDPAAAPGVDAALTETPSNETTLDVPGAEAPVPATTARTVEQFDTTSVQDRAEAAAPVSTGAARLGTTIASLGDPSDPGFWAETPLVTEIREGRLDYAATGKSVTVELRPSGGATGSGTRVSLPALRVLEAPLTDLPELVVFGL